MRARAGLTLRGVREVGRGPLHHADHHGDFIVVTDADLGMGIIWGAEGAQECDVLLKLGQGRAPGKSPLVLACIFVLRSHGHHLRSMDRARERAAPDPRAYRGALLVCHRAPGGGGWAGPNGPAKDLTPAFRGARAQDRAGASA
jgi:hypothetical protein